MTARIIYIIIPFALMALFFVFITMATPRANAQATNNEIIITAGQQSLNVGYRESQFGSIMSTNAPNVNGIFTSGRKVDLYLNDTMFNSYSNITVTITPAGGSAETRTLARQSFVTGGNRLFDTRNNYVFVSGTVYTIRFYQGTTTTTALNVHMAAVAPPIVPEQPVVPSQPINPSGFAQDGLGNDMMRFQATDLGNGNIGFIRSELNNNKPNIGVPLDSPYAGGVVYNPTSNRMEYSHLVVKLTYI